MRTPNDEREDDEDAPCCCCCCCRGCGKRGATLAFGAIGLLLAAAMIAPPAYVRFSTESQDYSVLFPVMKYARIHLERAAGNASSTANSTYRLAIFQLLDDCENAAPGLALASFCIGCLNIPLDLMLVLGAGFRKGFLLVPWMVATLVEHVVVGLPMIVFAGLIGLYLAFQLRMYAAAAALVAAVLVAFLASLSSWFTVYRCYGLFNERRCRRRGYRVDDVQVTQPLMNDEQEAAAMPNHQAAASSSYPSAPLMYPSLA